MWGKWKTHERYGHYIFGPKDMPYFHWVFISFTISFVARPPLYRSLWLTRGLYISQRCRYPYHPLAYLVWPPCTTIKPRCGHLDFMERPANQDMRAIKRQGMGDTKVDRKQKPNLRFVVFCRLLPISRGFLLRRPLLSSTTIIFWHSLRSNTKNPKYYGRGWQRIGKLFLIQ